MRDLLGDTSRPARGFTSDEHGDGFDNNADVLSLSPLQLEEYENAATRLVELAWARDWAPAQQERLEAESAGTGNLTLLPDGTAEFADRIRIPVELRSAGTFAFRLRVWGKPFEGNPNQARVLLDGRELGLMAVTAGAGAPAIYELNADAMTGPHTLTVEAVGGGTLAVDWVEVSRPAHAVPPEQAALRVCDPDQEGCTRQILERFLPAPGAGRCSRKRSTGCCTFVQLARPARRRRPRSG